MTLACALSELFLCVGISCATLFALRRGRTIRSLEVALNAANAAQRDQHTILTRRSELDTIKDEFISTVSHELRTPLTSIRGALGLLSSGLMGQMDAKAQNLLRIASTNTDRLIRLINDILDLERMQSGRAPLQIRRCSISELAQQCIESILTMADDAKVRVELVLAAAPEAVFFDGDGDRILQVLTNLLSNAVKFSPPSTAIQVRVEADSESVLVRVSDQGRGIPPDLLDAIFDRFQQVEAEDARKKGGTGLGLAICRTIVQQHNGTIWAESNVQQNRGPGASFTVALPRTKRLQDPTLPRSLTVISTTGEPTVILCDDDPGIRTVVGENLRQHGYTVIEAESGEQAFALASTHPVEAILLDLFMPGLTGWETLQRLRHSPLTANIPVVILSVLSPLEPSGLRHEVASAAQGWVQKPYNEHLLLSELSRVLHNGDGPSHILLVEDDHDLASVVMAGFEDSEVRIEHAATRHGAIEKCLRTKPDLLILDLTLPDGDGFSLVDWLRQQPDMRSLPLVVYSGREVSDTEMSKLRLGPTQFLTKAKVQPHEVEELVRNIVHRLRKPETNEHSLPGLPELSPMPFPLEAAQGQQPLL